MRLNKIYTLSLCLILMPGLIHAQQDTIKADSSKLYKDIESYSRKSKFRTFIYKLIFKSTKPTVTKKKAKKTYKVLTQKPYIAFEEKVIRHITIETLDPFGYSVSDTTVKPKSSLEKTGNNLHVKSKHITIRNLLLIHENQVFDSLLVKESERLVRSRSYIHNISFFIKIPSNAQDSVDITIRASDKWSIIPDIGLSATQATIELADKNFLGLGHESRNGITWHRNANFAYDINYFIPNYKNTYINSTLLYSADEHGNFTKSIAVDRPFFSPFANWAAGFSIKQQYVRKNVPLTDSLFTLQHVQFGQQDVWAGNAIKLSKGNNENSRTTNLITAIRLLRVRYSKQPAVWPGAMYMFSNENFYMASMGISTRKYVQDTYIFNFGEIEDVPVGKVFNITAGYQRRNSINRLFAGAKMSFGNFFSWGYLGSSIEYGSFFRAAHSEQGAVVAAINYFTGLKEIGKWKIRQFVKPEIVIGINRFKHDTLTLNKGYGLDGFNSSDLIGTSRILLTLQTQSYIPKSLLGFTFGPYLSYSAGVLGNATSGFQTSKLYSQIGIGVLIKNNNLVFGTFQISISFFPIIPGHGRNILKLNSLKTTDFGFTDFEIGKPAITNYE
ncbi:MAG TPA: hypothetical protein VHO72_05695 [Bacteroidales bacterium]|nr:hypothetical protein [Bacteroidales bacterium]